MSVKTCAAFSVVWFVGLLLLDTWSHDWGNMFRDITVISLGSLLFERSK